MAKNAYLLVDGYNVLNHWPDFRELKSVDLAHARDKITDVIANYAAFKGYFPVIVFDAYAVNGDANVENRIGIQIVFTCEGETADSYIEKMTYNLIGQKHSVFVVTGDYSEQIAILGMGAYRITSNELIKDCLKTCKNITERIINGRPLAHRREVASRLGSDIVEKLEKMRKNSNDRELD